MARPKKSRRAPPTTTTGAEQDLEAIHDYIAEFDSVANANQIRVSADPSEVDYAI